MMSRMEGSLHSVKLFSAWEQYGHLYLQMELCENGKYVDICIFVTVV